MDKKRIALILGFLAFSGLVGFGLYYVFFRQTPTGQTGINDNGTGSTANNNGFPTIGSGNQNTISTSSSGLPTNTNNNQGTGQIGTGSDQNQTTGGVIPEAPRVTRVVDTVVRSVSTAGGNARFYNSADGKFYRLDQGVPVPISDQIFYNVQSVAWSPNGSTSIMEYPDGSNIFYNFDTKEQVTLPRHWENFSFSPQGDKIVAKAVGIAPENRWLISSSPDGSSVRLLEALGNNADKVVVDWSPNRQVVALSKTGEPLSDDRQQILLVGQNKENFKALVVEGRGLQTKWSKTGSKLLHSVYSSASDFKPELWISDATPDSVGNNRKLLNVQTWASKCAMSDDRFVFCGVPEKLDTGAGFAPAIANTTIDRLYKIDTNTGLKTDIPLDSNHTIDTITLSDDGHTLYFTDKNQPGIFQVSL